MNRPVALAGAGLFVCRFRGAPTFHLFRKMVRTAWQASAVRKSSKLAHRKQFKNSLQVFSDPPFMGGDQIAEVRSQLRESA